MNLHYKIVRNDLIDGGLVTIDLWQDGEISILFEVIEDIKFRQISGKAHQYAEFVWDERLSFTLQRDFYRYFESEVVDRVIELVLAEYRGIEGHVNIRSKLS